MRRSGSRCYDGLNGARAFLSGAGVSGPTRLGKFEAQKRDLMTPRDPHPFNIHSAFRAQARIRRACPAVSQGKVVLTYGDVDELSDALAFRLLQEGVGPEDVVAVFLEQSPMLAVAFLGVLKAGCAYLPLDLAQPRERIKFILEDAGAEVAVCTTATLSDAPPSLSALVLLDTLGRTNTQRLPPNESSAETLAYVLYTSGSTGEPKGVEVEHGGVVNVARAQASLLGVSNAWRVLQFSSPSFDASIFEFVMALLHGGELCFPPVGRGHIEVLLLGLLDDLKISALTITPSALRLLKPRPLPSLEMLAVAGEACSPDLIDAWAPHVPMYNLYGPTEASIWATYAQCQRGEADVPIGRPIPGTDAFLLTEDGAVVEDGIGEIYLGGVGVARGYRARPDLTAERFVSMPGRRRVFRTGDLARRRQDGSLVFVGRVDDQTKVRGFRVEPAEIEAKMLGHPGVAEAAVIAADAGDDRKYLVGYWVERPGGGGLATPELREYLSMHLPGYMVPPRLVRVASLPRSSSRKLDRRRLWELARETTSKPKPREPANPIERRVVEIGAAALHVNGVGIDDDLLDLGADSLVIMQVAGQLADEYAVDPEAMTQLVVESMTLRELAQAITKYIGLEDSCP